MNKEEIRKYLEDNLRINIIKEWDFQNGPSGNFIVELILEGKIIDKSFS